MARPSECEGVRAETEAAPEQESEVAWSLQRVQYFRSGGDLLSSPREKDAEEAFGSSQLRGAAETRRRSKVLGTRVCTTELRVESSLTCVCVVRCVCCQIRVLLQLEVCGVC